MPSVTSRGYLYDPRLAARTWGTRHPILFDLDEVHGVPHLMHGLFRARARAGGALFQNLPNLIGFRFVLAAALLDGSEFGDDSVGQPAFALDAADTRGPATLCGLLLCFRGGKNLMQIEDRANIGIAGIAAANPRRVRDHGL